MEKEKYLTRWPSRAFTRMLGKAGRAKRRERMLREKRR